MTDDYAGDIIDAAEWLKRAYRAAQGEDWVSMANLMREAGQNCERVELFAWRKVRGE